MRRSVVAVVVVLSALLCSAVASAHVERSSYWPDPAPDTSITPAAGGAAPKVRTLVSAIYKKKSLRGPGTTRVVCQANSLVLLRDSIRRARKSGYDLRPHDHRTLSKSAAKRLLTVNNLLIKRCKFSEIQPAVMASGNNGRVIVMPGLYTEPTARAAKTDDPACAKDRITNDRGDTGAVSYAYQFNCPNDQNLIAVLGRALGAGKDPATPIEDRHGIPNAGPCIRCNLQLEGSGVSADDVIIEAGDASLGDKGPTSAKKDVGVRVDRADGFVLRNLKIRHAREHAIYVLESDGYLLDRFKTFYAGEYGVLTFVEDHGLMQNCEAAGSGDSGLYPGAGAETGAQRKAGTPFRYSQEIRFCDSHHNAGGYSGTDGNATWIHDNNFYDNALGFTTDVFTAPGHPGFPQDSDLVEHNNFYSNNFNPYVKGSDITPSVPVPVGTGMWIAGGNDNVVRNNHFYDNNRRGVMLFGVPDSTICSPGHRHASDRLRPEQDVDVLRQPVLRQRHGCFAEWRDSAQRCRLLVGQLRRQHGQLLVRQPRHRRQAGDDVPGPAAGMQWRSRPEPEHGRGRTGERGGAARVLRRDLLARLQLVPLPVVRHAAEAGRRLWCRRPSEAGGDRRGANRRAAGGPCGGLPALRPAPLRGLLGSR